ncbi:MAG: hypothetical protein LBM93_11250 [Oscillospiraceae bacterium]|jgi:peptidoglycan/LPS O-acetylase OafA/YrhL|nr:hypothetical protein [Oscillospiraceae bacterium]
MKIVSLLYIIGFILMLMSGFTFYYDSKLELLATDIFVFIISILSFLLYIYKDKKIMKSYGVLSIMFGIVFTIATFFPENQEIGAWGFVFLIGIVICVIIGIIEAIIYKSNNP